MIVEVGRQSRISNDKVGRQGARIGSKRIEWATAENIICVLALLGTLRYSLYSPIDVVVDLGIVLGSSTERRSPRCRRSALPNNGKMSLDR